MKMTSLSRSLTKNYNGIKGGESEAGSDTGDLESVIPPTAMESSSNNYFTKIKKMAEKKLKNKHVGTLRHVSAYC